MQENGTTPIWLTWTRCANGPVFMQYGSTTLWCFDTMRAYLLFCQARHYVCYHKFHYINCYANEKKIIHYRSAGAQTAVSLMGAG